MKKLNVILRYHIPVPLIKMADKWEKNSRKLSKLCKVETRKLSEILREGGQHPRLPLATALGTVENDMPTRE